MSYEMPRSPAKRDEVSYLQTYHIIPKKLGVMIPEGEIIFMSEPAGACRHHVRSDEE